MSADFDDCDSREDGEGVSSPDSLDCVILSHPPLLVFGRDVDWTVERFCPSLLPAFYRVVLYIRGKEVRMADCNCFDSSETFDRCDRFVVKI